MKAESPTPTLSPLDLQCDAYNSRLHGHQLPPCTLSAFILSPPKSLDQTSLDKAQSAAQQPMCKASVQSSEQQLAPRQVHHCTGLDVPAALDDMTGEICWMLFEWLRLKGLPAEDEARPP